jgi:hypothetical protein
MTQDIAHMVELLLSGGSIDKPSDNAAEFAIAVDTLAADGMDRHTAETLMLSAKSRGQNLLAWANHIVGLREEYRRKRAGS